MNRLYFFTIVFIVFGLFCPTIVYGLEEEKNLACDLKWILISNGDEIPDNAIEVHLGKHFLGRTQFEETYYIGTYSTEFQIGYFPLEVDDDEDNGNSTSYAFSNFEILTNPNECTLEWSSQRDGEIADEFSVPVTDDIYIGNIEWIVRANYPATENLWFGGALSQDNGGAIIATSEDILEFFSQYQVLRSFTNGITLELTDFEYETDPFGNAADFLGVDEIHNLSPVTINQTVTHRKKIIETYTVTTSRSWTSTYTKTFKIRLLFFSYTSTKTTTYNHATQESVTNTEVTEVSVSRGVSVPPYTSISACSTVSIKEGSEIQYQARAKYSGKGIKPSNLLEVLESDGIKNGYVVENSVVVDVTGTLKVALALNTEFYVKTFDEYNNGCDAIAQKIRKQKKSILIN